MYDAYTRVFSRCGLTCRPVAADTGAIGGEGSHEFMALSEIGESQILFCHHCDYAATDEIAAVDPVPYRCRRRDAADGTGRDSGLQNCRRFSQIFGHYY